MIFPAWENEEEPVEKVGFFSEDVDFEVANPDQLVRWIESVVHSENKQLHQVSFIFCSDAHLHRLNVEYLDHDTLTDVITFPYADPPVVYGDIFLSIDRIRENADSFSASFEQELHRVMIHGVLHLCGHGDTTKEQKAIIRQLENAALQLLSK